MHTHIAVQIIVLRVFHKNIVTFSVSEAIYARSLKRPHSPDAGTFQAFHAAIALCLSSAALVALFVMSVSPCVEERAGLPLVQLFFVVGKSL